MNPVGPPKGSLTFNPAGSPDFKATTAANASGDEFGRFADLTSKLVEVPKSELDKQRRAGA